MQQVAQAWLVLELTHDPIWLGIVSAAQFIPVIILGLFAGVAADALPKRRVLIATQTAMMVLAAILAVLVFTDVVEVWMILVLAFLLGIANAVDMPVRQAFSIEMVGREDVGNAVALNSAMFNGARVVGPALAGLAIAAFGVGPAFAINAVSFLAVIIGLAPDGRARRSTCRTGSPGRTRLGRSCATSRRACRYVRGTPIVLLAVVDRRRRGDGRHELQRPHPGLRPERPAERRRRLRLPDGRVGRRLAAGGGAARLRWPAACRSASRRAR